MYVHRVQLDLKQYDGASITEEMTVQGCMGLLTHEEKASYLIS